MVSVFINCLLWRSILANKTDEAGLFIPTPYFRNLMYYFLGVKILFRSWYPSYIACICPNLAILFNSNIWIAICCLFDRTEAHRFHDFPSKRVPWIYSLPTVLATVMLVIRSIWSAHWSFCNGSMITMKSYSKFGTMNCYMEFSCPSFMTLNVLHSTCRTNLCIVISDRLLSFHVTCPSSRFQN